VEEYAGDECGEALAVGYESGYGAVVEKCSREVVGSGGYLPKEYGGGCGDEGVVDDRCETGGILVTEGEHGLMVVGVSDIGVVRGL
jgi:hypothetical protein